MTTTCATLEVPRDWPVLAPPITPAAPVAPVDTLERHDWVERAVAFGRFVLVGGTATALTSVLFLLLGTVMAATVANTVATVVTTIVSNQAHARWTFRSGRRGAGMHLRAGLSVAITYPVTTLALVILDQVDPSASAGMELLVLFAGSAVAGLLRYLLLLVGVFPDSPAAFSRA